MTKFVTDIEIYETVIREMVPNARHSVWIGTADLKDLYLPMGKRRAVPFLQMLSELISSGIYGVMTISLSRFAR
jgi:hypothetical protein